MLKKTIKVAIIAGEPSGDDLGGAVMAALRAALKKKHPAATLQFVGVGGAKMTAAGLKPIFPMTKIAKMGILELLPHLPEILYLIRKTIVVLRQQKPDILITIDIPDFSKRVAKGLAGGLAGGDDKGGGGAMKKIHLVAPTVWAWRAGRRFKYAKIFDALFCLYPFEERYFADTRLKIFTMGHPLVAEVARAAAQYKKIAAPKNQPGKKQVGKNQAAPRVLLLAGSRLREAKYTLPLFRQFILQNDFLPPNTEYVFYTQPHIVPLIKKMVAGLAGSGKNPPIKIVADYRDKWRWFLSADLALVCMGTATLEVALSGAPMVAVYKTNWLTVAMVRRVIKVKTICLPNLLAGKNIVPEYIQEEATMEKIIPAAKRQFLLGRGGVKKNYDLALRALRATPDPARRAAQEIAKYL